MRIELVEIIIWREGAGFFNQTRIHADETDYLEYLTLIKYIPKPVMN